jgi:hypothetical protein
MARRRGGGRIYEPVTLGTPVPETPAFLHEQPNETFLEEGLDKIDNLINALKDHIERNRGEIRTSRLSSINEFKNP